ncbi:oocyte zinc finger protein XlCOF6 isoform X2 [Conger conger]|uniref:oocyte zinc finger protein XlCOF6 isoform X2 n=1 Tax=Conger conger TaxID=82655 RepID=UPI002A599D23|nr:oocyte zinc finger protein XlCOF6 isoform X2 [Conger conger]
MSLRMSNTLKTQIASIMEVMATAVLTEISKFIEGSAILCFEISQSCENEVSKVKLPVVESKTKMAQLASVIELLAQEAMRKICDLAIDESKVLRLEVTKSLNEIGTLKRKLELMDKELSIVQPGAAGDRPLKTHSVGVQDACELRATETEEPQSAVVSLCADAVPTVVEEEFTPLDHVVMIAEPSKVDNRIESVIIKEERLEEDLESHPLEGRLGSSKEVEPQSAVVSLCADAVPTVVEEEFTPLDHVVMIAEPSKVDNRIESVIIKEERLEEDLESHPLEGRLGSSKEGPTVLAAAAEKAPVAYQNCVEEISLHSEGLACAEGQPMPARPGDNGSLLNGKCFKKRNDTKSRRRGDANGEKPLICTHCKKSFATLLDLKTHRLGHSAERPYSCTACGKSFTLQCRLRLHMRTHTGEKPFCCDVCGKTFRRAYDLKKHQIVHTGERAFSCQLCGKSFTIEGNLHRHQRIHTGEKPFLCTLCGKSFNQAGTLQSHKRIHTGEKPYVCATCGKRFSLKSRVKAHQQVHGGGKAHACVVCGKGFGTAGPLRTHLLTHAGENPCTCARCGETLTSLRSHEQCHAGLKAFVCVVCGKSFRTTGSLKIHEKTHSAGKRFSCQLCGKTFTQRSSLNTHQYIHTGEKPFSCDMCGKSFRIVGNLNRHRRIHTGEKPYHCFQCGKSFNQVDSLKAHELIHTGEKPYVCDKCGKRFAHLRNLKGHKCVFG